MIATGVKHESVRGRNFLDLVERYKKLKQYRAVMVGDLFGAFRAVPKALWRYGDLPFARRKGCPDALAVAPHPAIVGRAREWVRSFGPRPFLGVHWRAGDFWGQRRCHQQKNALSCLGPRRVAECAAVVMRATGLRRVVITSDANAASVTCLLFSFLFLP